MLYPKDTWNDINLTSICLILTWFCMYASWKTVSIYLVMHIYIINDSIYLKTLWGPLHKVIMSMMASQISSISIVCSAICSGTDIKKKKKKKKKTTSKPSVTGLCDGNPPVTSGLSSKRASNIEKVSIWWCYNARKQCQAKMSCLIWNYQIYV